MKELLNYNFSLEDIADKHFDDLFESRRRDSAFAFVCEDESGTYAMRDHLGICPLWYMETAEGWKFSTSLADLPHDNEIIEEGLRSYLALGTTKLKAPFKGVYAVPPGAVLYFENGKEPKVVYQYKVHLQTKSTFFQSFNAVVAEVDCLLRQAIERQLKGRTSASLYLSGGIDSALIGLYLKELGCKISTFTNLKEKNGDDEQRSLEINLQSIEPVNQYIETSNKDYEALLPVLIKHFQQPIGNVTALAVANLWECTPISDSPIVFFGQNSDVINNAMDNGAVTTFGFPIPPRFFKYIGGSLSGMFDSYMSKISEDLLTRDPIEVAKMYEGKNMSNFNLVALAGMYLRRTPVDSELLAQPAINYSVPIGNPFYDMDVVEYLMNVSIRHKISFKRSNNLFVSLDKRVLQSLALSKGLPEELVYRKKGFTVSRQKKNKAFFEQLPQSIFGVDCKNEDQKFAALIINKYVDS